MAVAKGLALAAANVVLVAIGIAVAGQRPVVHLGGIPDVAAAIIVYGGVPGLLTGAILGWLAQAIEAQDRRLRMFVLTALAIIAVAMLGAAFDMPRDVVPACVPTIACALTLERWTRRLPPPPIPIATARPTPGESRID